MGPGVPGMDQFEEISCNFTSDWGRPLTVRQSFNTALALATQLPHWVPQPVLELRSRKLFTPSLTASRMAESLTALQIQIYMFERLFECRAAVVDPDHKCK